MFVTKLLKKLIGFIIAVVIVFLVLDFILEEDDSIVADVVESVSDIKDELLDDYDEDDYDDDYYDNLAEYDNDYYDDDYYDDEESHHNTYHNNHSNYDDYDYDEHGGHHGNNSPHGYYGQHPSHEQNNYDYVDYGHDFSTTHHHDQMYSDVDSYDWDSWAVLDYYFSYIGDDYGYDNYDYDDYSHYYNYDDYDDAYSYDYDYNYDYNYDYGNDYYGEKPSITTTCSGNTGSTESVVPVSVSTQRQRFIEYALSLKGTPYLYGGKTPAPGIDCSGLIAFSARKAISVNFTGSAQMMYDSANDVPLSNAEPGDLLFFSDTGNGITHVAIFLGKNSGQGANDQRMMVHSASDGASTGVIVSSIDQSNYWSKHLVGAKAFLSSSKEVRSITRSKNKKTRKSSPQSAFENDSWWDDVDPSWFK